MTLFLHSVNYYFPSQNYWFTIIMSTVIFLVFQFSWYFAVTMKLLKTKIAIYFPVSHKLSSVDTVSIFIASVCFGKFWNFSFELVGSFTYGKTSNDLIQSTLSVSNHAPITTDEITQQLYMLRLFQLQYNTYIWQLLNFVNIGR